MIDTHVHLNFCKRPATELIDRAVAAGVSYMVQVAVDYDTAVEAHQQFKDHDNVGLTAGVHPLYVDNEWDEDAFVQWIKTHHRDLVAIGEIGLDYKYDVDKQRQHDVFHRFMALARELQLPAIIHNRKADDECRAVIDQYPDVPVVLHCFNGSLESVVSYDHPNLWLSFTGMITAHKKSKTIQTIRHWPLDKLMIETDCPYLTPVGYEGQENEPAMVGAIAAKIAEVKELDIQDVIDATTRSAQEFFGLD